VLLIAPLTFVTARALELNPVPLLYTEIIASNIGGTATLVGDPPNILIGSRAGLSFVEFIVHLTPVVGLVALAVMGYLALVYRKEFGRGEVFARRAAEMPQAKVKDPVLLWKCLVVLGLVVVGFLLHGRFGFEASTVALLGATLLLLIARADPHVIFGQIEWPTLFFFVGLFIVVGAVGHAGLLERIGRWVVGFTGGRLIFTSMAVLWLSALLSAIVDNIPATMALVPVILAIAGATHPGVPQAALAHLPYTMALWWSLALGACLGGNATIVGASANVVVAGLAERFGFPISFRAYLKVGIPATLLSLVISAAYILLRYVI
jgi:Na+/H+ antiporter NhaD/arsenite permease-like protein